MLVGMEAHGAHRSLLTKLERRLALRLAYEPIEATFSTWIFKRNLAQRTAQNRENAVSCPNEMNVGATGSGHLFTRRSWTLFTANLLRIDIEATPAYQ